MSTRLDTPVRIHLIRHGETEWSASGRHTGVTDLLLTARGEDEARALAPRLRDIPFTHTLTSPRQRARQTSVLAGLGPAAEIDPNLAEWDYGDYEGLRTIDIRETQVDWNIFSDGCPNGESPAQVSDRADHFIARIRALEGSVAVFTHGHFGCVLGARWIGLPILEAQHFYLGTASLSILGYDAHNTGVSVIALWNAASNESPASALLPDARDAMTMKQQAVEREEMEDGDELPVGAANGFLKIDER